MTRDTDRPRRGTDRPARARPPRSTDKRGAPAEPPRGDGQRRGSGKTVPKAFDKANSDRPNADRPKRDGFAAKPKRAAPRAIAKSAEPVATIAQAESQRIAKLMARVGLCSRRDAEAWIVDGRVTLNGAILTSPAVDVGPNDTILVDGIPLPAAEKTRLFLFHKPRGLVTSDHDPEGRETVADHLAANWPDGPRVVTIGRLDINTEGLLLLTNDGGLARILELPATGWVRRYRVRAKGETDQGVLDRLHDGLVVDGVDYAGIEAKLDRIQGANCWLTMGLREGKNREIKRVLEHLGLEVNRLIRLSHGPFQLLDLAEGAVEEVKTRVLRDQLGETLAAEAGVDFADSDAPIVAPPAALPQKGAKTARRNEVAKPERRVEAKRGERDRSARPAGRSPKESGEDEPAPIRERPVAGTRRHVSTLRAEVASDKREGPRKRIERTATTDRKDRTVTVERLVRTRGLETELPRARRGPGRLAPRKGDVEGRKSARGHASPSALAKRERIAKSGGERPRDRATSDRSREDRDERRNDSGRAKVRSVRPDEARERPVRERAPADARREGSTMTRERQAGEDKPWRRERTSTDARPKPTSRGATGRGDRSPTSFQGAKSFAAKTSEAKSFRAKSIEGRSSGAKSPMGAKRTMDRATGTKSSAAEKRDRPARGSRPPRGEGKSDRPARARASRDDRENGAGVKRSPARGTTAPGKPSKPRSPKC